ncbi:hypothetical protein AXI71_gp20 [Lactococcus phage GE1]|uniref:Uncharacterized protein n=1 Tax=Lactococcus phage GE1 TaxID=1698369 RepID=A0A0N6WMQ3_9CAUD|nr:hypothetical protein AXI71_gp20 [Lactococcus phage GE1]ALA06974.1 hypothetical protein [Lactococcus phage GE1]
MDYYENEHGKDVRDFIMTKDPERWAVISMFNALKYRIRAGKKSGESLTKDFVKMRDYLEDYAEVTEQSIDGAYEDLYVNVEDFGKYE